MVSVSRLFSMSACESSRIVLFSLTFFFCASYLFTVFAGYRPGYEWWESMIMFRKCCFVMLSIFLGMYGATPQVRKNGFVWFLVSFVVV